MREATVKNEYEFFKSHKNALELGDSKSFTGKSVMIQLANEKKNAIERFQLWCVPTAKDVFKIDIYVGKNVGICDMKTEKAIERKFSRVSMQEAIELLNKAQKHFDSMKVETTKTATKTATKKRTATKKTESETA
jgi:hypothetical protein